MNDVVRHGALLLELRHSQLWTQEENWYWTSQSKRLECAFVACVLRDDKRRTAVWNVKAFASGVWGTCRCGGQILMVSHLLSKKIQKHDWYQPLALFTPDLKAMKRRAFEDNVRKTLRVRRCCFQMLTLLYCSGMWGEWHTHVHGFNLSLSLSHSLSLLSSFSLFVLLWMFSCFFTMHFFFVGLTTLNSLSFA